MAAAPVPLETAPLSIAEKIEKARKIKLADGSSPSDTDIITHLIGPDKYEALKKADVSEADILTHLTGSPSGKPLESPKAIESTSPIAKGLGGSGDLGPQVDTDHVIDFMRPLLGHTIGGLTGAATGALSIPSTGGTATIPATIGGYMAGYSAADMALQYAKSKKPDSLLDAFTESGKSGLINAGMNWAIPAATRAIGNIYKEVSDPGSVIGSFAQLNPTTAQLHKYIFGGKGLVSQSVKWIEDIFASGAKATAIDKSAELGTKAGNELIGARQGDYNPNEFFQTVKGKITSAGEDSLANSNRLGDSAVASAQNFPHTFMQTVQTPTGSVRLPQTVAAPIPLNNTLAAAEKMVAEFDSGSGSAAGQGFLDPKQAELRKMAQSIIDKSRDPNGGVNPVSFREAWTLKKLADRFQMYEKSRSKFELRDPTSSEPYFKTLSESMNDDIDNGLKTLKGNPLEKAKLVGYWKDAKAAVGQRLALMDAEGDKLIDVIKSKQTELPVLDEILADPKQLHRALALGEVQFPGGGQAKQSVRSDYITYKIQKMYNDSWSTSASDPTKKVFDAAKLMDTWNDPKFKDSKDLLFSQKLQGEYDQLFKQIAATQGKQQMSNARLWALKAGISVMPGLALGHISGLPSTGATAAVGLGMGVIGKLMTMKGMSRALIAAASGAPLGMSTEAFARAVAKAAAGGGVMTLIGSDGKETRGEVDADGQFVQK